MVGTIRSDDFAGQKCQAESRSALLNLTVRCGETLLNSVAQLDRATAQVLFQEGRCHSPSNQEYCYLQAPFWWVSVHKVLRTYTPERTEVNGINSVRREPGCRPKERSK